MRRRALLATIVAGVGLGSGCLSPFTDDSVALRIENRTDSSHTVDLIVGGTVVPDTGPSEDTRTATSLGRTEVTFERTVSLDPQETRQFGEVLTYTDVPEHTGVTVDVDDRPQRRVPVFDLHTDRNLIVVQIHEDEIEVSVTQK